MLKIVSGDIFQATEKYIAHQCNCITQKASHLSANVFAYYPHADIYTGRTTPDKPGSIIIRGNGQDQRFVINILGQYYPGKPKYPNSFLDGYKARQQYFYQALNKIAQIPKLASIAFSYGIGGGAAGGDWEVYFKILNNFADYVKTDVIIYRKENNTYV